MSDGPFKSLPLPAHWRAVARRAEAAAYSGDEVSALYEQAVRKDFRRTPHEQVRAVLCGDGQGLLFSNDRIERLEALRRGAEGAAASDSLIDCAIEQVYSGAAGESAFDNALKNAQDEHCRAMNRAAGEHYQRKGSPEQVEQLRSRTEAARQLLHANGNALGLDKGSVVRASAKKTGIDEGPEK